MEATKASSGSTFAAFDHGAGTPDGDGDAGTMAPPSNVHVCSREYLPFTKSGPARFQRMMALCSDIFQCGDEIKRKVTIKIASHAGERRRILNRNRFLIFISFPITFNILLVPRPDQQHQHDGNHRGAGEGAEDHIE